jgi:glycosyltransferase involved in cell wall biosynthesis
MARNLGIAACCSFAGSVPKSIANQYNNLADVLISPRVSGNNTPLKIYEQIASGIPLVATRIRSHTQVLTDDYAFLVEPEPEAMANGILEAMKSDAESKRKARNARELYQRSYSRQTYKHKIKQVLEFLASCAE